MAASLAALGNWIGPGRDSGSQPEASPDGPADPPAAIMNETTQAGSLSCPGPSGRAPGRRAWPVLVGW